MINFIFVISIVCFLLLGFSFIIKNYAFGMISALGIMSIGVHVLSDGISGIENLLTITLGTVFICLGSYVFLVGSLEKIEDFNYGGTKW